MSYKVINRFIDKVDKTIYEVGEEFPKGDSKPSTERIAELSKVHPKYKIAFIEEVKAPKSKSKKTTKKE